MKIKGKKISGPNIEIVVIPRREGDIVFKAEAVLDYEDFDKLNPAPEAPVRLLRGGIKQENVEDPKYLEALDEWAASRTHFMILKSLQATEDLEWETVDMSNPTTWGNYHQEMKDSGFSAMEINRIVECVTDACGLNQEKIDEATNRFLAGQVAAQDAKSSQSTERETTQSGEPVSASA